MEKAIVAEKHFYPEKEVQAVQNEKCKTGKSFKLGSRFTVYLSCVVLALFCVGLTGTTAFAKSEKEPSGKKRILVQYRSGLSADEVDRNIKRHKGRVARHLRGIKARVLELAPEEDVDAAISSLLKNPLVKFAEEDRLVPAEAILTNDPYSYKAWHLEKIQAPTAWQTSLGSNVVVAVLDTGVDETHPDLAGQTVPGWNIYDDNTDTTDVYGHGTKVAGTIAAASNNGIGVTSIAWNSLIMPVRISRPDGYASISDISDGIIWAADQGAQVVNISYDVSGSPTIQSAAAYLRERGGVVVVAAGNSAVYRPGAANLDVIAVGATSNTDALASFSNYGEFVDLVAPGVSIMTTAKGGGYSAASGTSFSSPVVAAVAALMVAANPVLTPAQIHSLLNETADDLGGSGFDIYFGHGRVNAGAAVGAAWAFSGVDGQEPTVVIASPLGGTVSGIVPVSVTAEDNVSVSRVELFSNGMLVGAETAAPYSFSWDSISVADGPVTLVAYAYDAAGNRGMSSALTLTVKNSDSVAPSVAITSPAGGVVNGNITIAVNASDNVGVSQVALYLNGSLLGTDTSAPYSFNWNSVSVNDGPVTLVAYAYDAAGNRGVSSAVTLAVKNADTVAPTVAIASPTGGSVTGAITITVSASDNVSVSQVALYLNGGLIGTDATAPYSFSWDSKSVGDGSVTLIAYAFDVAGNQAASSAVLLTVKNAQVAQVPGDLDHDGDVDYTDYRILMSSYRLAEGTPGYLSAVDYDGDKSITYADYRIWYGYYRAFVYGI